METPPNHYFCNQRVEQKHGNDERLMKLGPKKVKLKWEERGNLFFVLFKPDYSLLSELEAPLLTRFCTSTLICKISKISLSFIISISCDLVIHFLSCISSLSETASSVACSLSCDRSVQNRVFCYYGLLFLSAIFNNIFQERLIWPCFVEFEGISIDVCLSLDFLFSWYYSSFWLFLDQFTS